ncbi:hypothetical protein CENSYa_1193 [Cenarchaeum symbiosum A]|uniref:Uncharacterized protein n=1 Tax=Cenarchaeum symbiosum (strain A) TaxID=414004 RepID=A0RWV0_CENSY|nr:hypothetical protein CENSYa_1193 [Cenarchaeum symbiosum A]
MCMKGTKCEIAPFCANIPCCRHSRGPQLSGYGHTCGMQCHVYCRPLISITSCGMSCPLSWHLISPNPPRINPQKPRRVFSFSIHIGLGFGPSSFPCDPPRFYTVL